MFKGNMLKEQQYNNQAKSGKNEQNQTMVKIGKKILGTRLDMICQILNLKYYLVF